LIKYYKNKNMAIKKQYLKSKSTCKVTFTIDENRINDFQSAHLVGDFNNWDADVSQMKKTDKGLFSITLELEPQKDYQFRYLLDKSIWLNEEDADLFVPSPFRDSENSMLKI
jgi:1,4-alpha-glucan branching enzyme